MCPQPTLSLAAPTPPDAAFASSLHTILPPSCACALEILAAILATPRTAQRQMRRTSGSILLLLLLAVCALASAVSALSLLPSPTALTCQSGPNSGSVVLYFTGTSDSSLLYYEVSYTTPLGVSVSVVSSQSPVVLTSLTPGFSYGFAVATVNAVGSSAAATTTCVGGDVPSVPLNPTTMWNATTSTLLVGWNPPATTGGTKALTYRVSLYNATGTLMSTQDQSRSPATIYPVPANGDYTWTVFAFNTIGQGVATNATVFTLGAAATVPTVPQNLVFTATASGMQVAFSPPAFDGGSAILSYTLRVNGGSAVTSTSSPMITGSMLTGSYTFTLVATNAIGSSVAATSVLTYNPSADTPPSPPANVAVSVVGSLMSVTWTASVSSSVKYIVYVSSKTGNTVTPLNSVNSDQTTGTSLTIDGFCTSSYLVYVKAVSTLSGLMSVASSPLASATTTSTAPGVPTNIQIVNLGPTSVAVYFGPPATGSIVTLYTLKWSQGGIQTVAGSNAPLIATGLLPAPQSTSLSLLTDSECDALSGTSSSIPVVPKEPLTYRAPISVTLNASSIVLSSGQATVSFNVTTPESITHVSFYDLGSGVNTNIFLSSQLFDPVTPSANTVTFSGLTDGTFYSIYAIARTYGGKTADSNVITFRPYGPITAPQNFTCVPGPADEAISCTWNPPASLGGLSLQAQGYVVTPTPGTAFPTAGNSIVLGGLVVDSPYSISIYARTAITISPSVTLNNVYPGDPPEPPSASCTDDAPNQVTLTIVPSLDTGGMDPAATSGGMSLISYEIQYSIAGVVQLDLNNSLSTTRTFSATPGAEFRITVTSWNSAGESPPSSPVASCTAANVPSCPLNLALYPGLVNAGALFANWTQESSNGGAAVTQYLVTWTGDVSGERNITAPLREIQLTGLTPNNANYTVMVQARNRKGLSTGCTALVGQASGTPGAPVLSSLVSGNTMLFASLVASNQTGGVPLILWNCSWTPVSASGSTFQSFSYASSMPLALTGLTNGVSYSISCRVTNSIGLVSAASNILAAIPATVPNRPIAFNATTGPGLGQLNVSWVPSTNNGGNALEGFNITFVGLTAAGGSGFRYVSPAVAPYALQLSGLVPGEFYTLTIQARNSLGISSGAVSGENSLVAQAGGPPCPPLNVLVTPGNKYLEVRWDAPTCDGGLALKMYWIWTTSATGPNAIVSVLFGPSVTRAVNLTGLVNGVSYSVFATAANVAANSTAALGSPNPVSPLSAPSAPILTGTSVLDSALVLQLSPPLDLGGRTLAGYTCFMNSSSFAPTSWLETPIAFGPTDPFQVTGLTNGANYSFACYASNSAGLSGPFSGTVFGSPAQVPGPPTDAVAISGPAIGQINVSWVAPLSSGGSSLTSFIVSWKDSTGGRNDSVVVSATASWRVLSPLVPNITYTISIQAVNAQGASAITPGIGSHVVSAVAANVPCPPLNAAAIRGNASLSISWDTPLCNGGMPITGYWIFVTAVATGAGSASFVPVGSLSYTQSGLALGAAYSVSLSAANALGNSTLVSTSNVIPATVPSAPTNFGCQSGPTLLGSITMRWSLPLSFGGDPSPTSYNFTVTELSSGVTFVRNCINFGCVLESLTPRSNYSMIAVAINTVGAGSPTAPIYCTAAAVPDQIAPVACSGSNLQVTLAYAAPYSNLDFTSFEANYTAALATTPQTATRLLLPVTSLTGLTNDVFYSVTVRGCNALGCGVASAPIKCQPGVPPTVPTSVQCKPENTKIHLVYSVPAGGSAATSYSALHLADQTLQSTTGLEIVFSGYAPNTAHSYLLWARNAHGSSSNVSVTCSTLQLAPPDNVLSFLDLAQPATTCAVWFTPYPQIPSSGSFATHFIVQYAQFPSTLYAEINSTSIPVFIPGLVANQIYNLLIYASNGFALSASTSGSCNTGAVYDPSRIPSAPGARSSPGAGQAVVALSLPNFQGTAPDVVSSYRLFTSGSAGASITASVDSDLSFVTVPGLTNGLQYYHYALADNNQGLPSPVPLSLPSPIVSEVPSASYTVPTTPTQASIQMTPGDTSVAFDVLSAAGNPSGSPLLGYVVRWPVTTPGSPVVAGSSASNSSVATVPRMLAHSNLINGVGTLFTVEAINGAGASAPLYTPSVTPGRVPGPPVNVVASPRDQGADIFFQPPLDPGTNTVTGYYVYYRDAGVVALSPKTGPPIPIAVDSLTNGVSNNLTICAYSSVSGTYAGAPPLWQSAPGSCASFSVIPFARPLPSLNGTLIFSAPIAASLRTGGVQALDNFCLTRMAYTRAIVCDPTSGRTFLSALTYLPAAAPVFAFNAFLKPVAAYSKIASSPNALLASGIQTSESLGFAANFTTFFDETAPVGAVVSPSVSNLATTVAFTGCDSLGAVSAGFGTCNGWTSTLVGDSASTGKDFALSSVSDFASGWLDDGVGATCDQDLAVYCAWFPSASDGVRNGDETGVDCGGTTLFFNGQASFPCNVPPPVITCPAVQYVPTSVLFNGVLILPNLTVSSLIRYDVSFAYIVAGVFPHAEARTGDSISLLSNPTMLIATAIDGKGQQGNCTFPVVVRDVEPPTIVCPLGPVLISADPGFSYATGVTYPASTAFDNVPLPVTISGNPPASQQFPVGSNIVFVYATDAAGNVANCSFELRVGDAQAPVLTYCPPAIINQSTDIGQRYATLRIPQPIAVDNVGLVNPLGVQLSGAANGSRIYVPRDTGFNSTFIRFMFEDTSGNQVICAFTMEIIDMEPPALVCASDVTTFTDPFSSSAVLTLKDAVVSDNVNLTGSVTQPQFTVGVSKVQVTARDERGNIGTCTYSVTVIDNEPPRISCPPDMQTTLQAGEAIAAVNWTAPVSTDNVGVVSVTSNYASGDYFPVSSVNVVTYTARDAAGLSASCSFVLRVLSSSNPPSGSTAGLGDPGLQCPSDLVRVASYNSEPPTALVNWLPPSLTNTRLVATLSGSALGANNTYFTVGTRTLTYALTDAQGNGVTCSFRVSVLYPTAQPEGAPSRGQLSLRNVTTDVLSIQRHLVADLAAVLQISAVRISVIAVVAAFNRTDVVFEFAPRAPTYYTALAAAGSGRRLLAALDSAESEDVLLELQTQLNDPSSALYASAMASYIVSPSTFVNCSDAFSAPWVERATGCQYNSSAALGFQCPAGCVPLTECASGSGALSDRIVDKQWFAIVMTCACWLALLLLLFLLQACGVIAFTGAIVGYGQARVKKQPPVVPWPHIRNNHFRPLSEDNRGYMQ